MRNTSRLLLSPVLLAFATLAGASLVPSAAQADDALFGLRMGYYTKAENPFGGVELILPLSHRVYANPNVEYVFIDNLTYLTYNLDFHYDLPSHSRAFVWLGAGLGVISQNPDGPAPTDTEVAANFLAGVGLSRHRVIPYFQAKLVAKGDTEFVVAFGLRF